MTITIADGRGALWQWDTGRKVKITDGTGVKQIHYQNKCFGRSVDVDVGTDGTAIIPDELLQDWHPLTAYAYVTDDAGGYTKVQVDFAVHKRARPSDYVYTPTERAGFDRLRAEIGDLDDLTTEDKSTLVAAINEAAASGGSGLPTPAPDNSDDGKTMVVNGSNWEMRKPAGGRANYVFTVDEDLSFGVLTATSEDNYSAILNSIKSGYDVTALLMNRSTAIGVAYFYGVEIEPGSIQIMGCCVSFPSEEALSFYGGHNAVMLVSVTPSVDDNDDSPAELNAYVTSGQLPYKPGNNATPQYDATNGIWAYPTNITVPAATAANNGKIPQIVDGKWELVDAPSGGGVRYQIGSGLKLDAATNTLSVDAADAAQQDNTKPITSAAVYAEVGNINALLATL